MARINCTDAQCTNCAVSAPVLGVGSGCFILGYASGVGGQNLY